jgi:hypothetical protein
VIRVGKFPSVTRKENQNESNSSPVFLPTLLSDIVLKSKVRVV